MPKIHWLADHLVRGALAFRIGVDDRDILVAEWIGIGRLSCDRGGENPCFEELPGAPPATLNKVKNAAKILVRQLSGGLAFHGACVVLDERAVLFTGDSGAGKSTLSAWIVEREGGELVSDDLTPVACDERGVWVAQPFESESWLDAASITAVSNEASEVIGKRARLASHRAATPARLAAIVDLDFSEDLAAPDLSVIDGTSAIGVLLRQCVRFAIDEPERQLRELDALIGLASSVPILRLVRRRDLGGLRDTTARIERWLRNA